MAEMDDSERTAQLLVSVKCRLVRGDETFNIEEWKADDVSDVIAIRRRQLEVDDVAMFTLHQLLVPLQSLFLSDMQAYLQSDKVNPTVRIWAQVTLPTTSSESDGDMPTDAVYTLLTCDKDIQMVLETLQDDQLLNIDMQLMTPGVPHPAGTHGVQPANSSSDDDSTGNASATAPDGPFPIDPNGQHVSEPTGAGMVDTTIACDVFVAGGGSAGIGAALGAAKSGVSVVCVHGRPVLGGNASSEVKLHMVGADLQGGRGKELEVEAREGGVLEEIRLDNSMCNPQFCAEMLDLTFLDKFRSYPNLQLLLNTWLVSATVDSNTGSITGVVAESQLTQRRYNITAKVYIDATGDGRLGAEAKCQYRQGREAQSEYNESLAMLKADTATEGSSLAFHSRDMGKPMPFKLPPTFTRRFTTADCRYRRPGNLDYGYWWVELAWPWDTVSDGGLIASNLLEAMMGIWDYIKNSGEVANSENWALDWFGYLPCKREARRVKGVYVQTQNDIIPSPTSFSDAVCHSGWGIDLHNPQGIDDPARPPYSSTYVPYIYGTPLRCFVSCDAANMMMAGRLASFTHCAYGSQRVMATCNVHGQAAGTAAAYAAQHMMSVQDVCKSSDAVWSVQQQLLRDDQFIPGQVNQDPRDQALTATVTATTEQDDGPAKAVISGQTRAVFGKGGCMSSQCLPGTNRWISNGLPATLTLMFKQPIASVGQVELVFDTGLYRLLTFSIRHDDQVKQIWGRPMPETVKDYVIEALPADGSNAWQNIMSVEDNYQRKRIHMIGYAAKCAGIRITVTATNGIANARICEVRVYEIGNGGKFPVKPKGLKAHPLLDFYTNTPEEPSPKATPHLQLAPCPEPQYWKEREIVA